MLLPPSLHDMARCVMNKQVKPVPDFKTEAAERAFWETHDSTEYVDWQKAQWVRFPNLKPSSIAKKIERR